MGNYFQQYFQGKYGIVSPGKTGKHFYKTNYIPSDKQVAYHKNLCEFLDEKGVDISLFKTYKTKKECSSKINGLLTTLKKRGYEKEFFGSKEESS